MDFGEILPCILKFGVVKKIVGTRKKYQTLQINFWNNDPSGEIPEAFDDKTKKLNPDFQMAWIVERHLN